MFIHLLFNILIIYCLVWLGDMDSSFSFLTKKKKKKKKKKNMENIFDSTSRFEVSS